VTTDRKASTAAALDEMVAGIMGVKADQAAKLTPVGTETATISEGYALPSDLPTRFMAREIMVGMAKDLRRHAQALLETADGIDVILGVPDVVQEYETSKAEVKEVLAQKETERRTDDREKADAGDKHAQKRVRDAEDFDQRMKRLSDEAQAATYAAVTSDDSPGTDGWACTTHGAEDLRDLTSPKGRKYRACGVPNCKEFQK
jgi:hypothetical protein